MSATAIPRAQLTWGELASMMRLATKDKSYERTPVGVMVKRYLRWFRNEYGATAATIRDYEPILSRMCLTLADRELIEVSTEDLRAVIDLWSDCAISTRQKITSIVRSFWEWCEDEGHIAISPAARIRRPKGERKVARPLPVTAGSQMIEAAKHPRDRLALYLLLTCGIRRAELGALRMWNLDAGRRLVRVYGKGRKEREIPLRGAAARELHLLLSSDLPALERLPEPDDFLIYPIERRTAGRGREGQPVWQHVARPKDQPSTAAVNRWWYRIAWDAGLVPRGVLKGLNMHQARHLFAMQMRRAAGIEAASQALGHANLNTTLMIYGHQDQTDLERAFDRFHAWLDRASKESDSPDD